MYNSYLNIVDRSIYNNIRNVGRQILVYHRTATPCGCSGNIDPVYGIGGFNPNCATCDGTGVIYTDTAKSVRCIVNKFVGNRGFVDEHQRIQILDSRSEIKVTCWLDSALVNTHSTMGATYFSSADKVWVDDRYYQPKNEKRILSGSKYALEVVLGEVIR